MIVAGWFVVYNNSLKIEKRKEAREFVQDIEILIDKIYVDVISYYTNGEEHIGPDTSLIKSNFLLISHYLFVLKSLGLNPNCSQYLTQFRRSSTGGFFETKEFKNQCNVPGWDSEIANSASQLKLSLRICYYKWVGAYNPPRAPLTTQYPV